MKIGSEIGGEKAAEATKHALVMAELDTAAKFAFDERPLDPVEALRVR